MKTFGIKIKLIIIFVIIKVIPLILIAYIAIIGAQNLNKYFNTHTQTLLNQNKEILKNTTSKSIDDSINALDKKSQESLEKLSVTLAVRVADFLYERDNDILFLSKLSLLDGEKALNSFYNSKKRDIVVHGKFTYDDKNKKWIDPNFSNTTTKRDNQNSLLKDNQKEFHFVDPIKFQTKSLPIYKEISFVDLKGMEIYKISSIKTKKINVSKKDNTYIKSESYWDKIQKLKKDEIYVSDVIGEYVPSKVIGPFTKEKASKMKVDFKPELHGYAGAENPNGKKFEGIIRYITPVYKNSKKIGYISMALDHRHVMEFTDSFDPINPNIKQNIANAGAGNYAFMWDYEARNISHPRDYFIVGFDKNTGERVPGWLSAKVASDFKESKNPDLNDYLKTYPKFDNQSLEQKPNIAQLKQSGQIALDCRYLNFAPQCQGWMQLTQNGGYGSFVIFWSKVWKLSTAATIPYYTGQYGDTKRGFGFVTIGANVDEFHKAATKTKENINTILAEQTKRMKDSLDNNKIKISNYIDTMIVELGGVTVFMLLIVILIAIWMSNYITQKIYHLIDGTKKFSQNNLDFQLDITSNDEMGELEKSFNKMAKEIKDGIDLNKNKELQLIQKTKMAEMGDMMGAIVHQWKQPLGVIKATSSSSQLAITIGTAENKELFDSYDNINKQIDIMSQTMDDFGNFFKPTVKKEYKLQEISSGVHRMLNGIYKSKGVNINLIIVKDSIINGYPTELMQVIINILNNGRDVILERKPELMSIDFVVGGDDKNGIITITDFAGGIPEDIIGKIFQPYFTTKSSENGTGIGLDMSQSIIKKAEGELSAKNTITTIENKKYKGASFTIKLKRKS